MVSIEARVQQTVVIDLTYDEIVELLNCPALMQEGERWYLYAADVRKSRTDDGAMSQGISLSFNRITIGRTEP